MPLELLLEGQSGNSAPSLLERIARVRGARAHPAPDGEWRIWTESPDRPFYSAGRTADHVCLRLSYTSPEFMRLLPEFLNEAIHFADLMNVSCFIESPGGIELSPQKGQDGSLEAAPGGMAGFWKNQAATWQYAVSLMQEEARGSLEFSVGNIDAVNEFFLLHARLDAPVGDPGEVVASTSDGLPGLTVHAMPGGFSVRDASRRRCAKFLVRGERTVQIWPDHANAWFPEKAKACLAVADWFAAQRGAAVAFNGVALTAELRGPIESRIAGDSTSFMEWWSTRPDLR